MILPVADREPRPRAAGAELERHLDAIEADLQGHWDRLKVIKAEDVTLANREETEGLKMEGRRLAQDLANLLDVDPLNLPFGTGGGGVSGVATATSTAGMPHVCVMGVVSTPKRAATSARSGVMAERKLASRPNKSW